ncbi:MAG: hypothetical protein LPK19_13110, partial [Hymenobacteraceae bacterium]|nr:hypothetical protein [Hymenobacteraceae bacterium]MDX5397167.1 hypothetical protein [Hymenobacteraceae bacterium]MDX5513242.1 hypothetical protein [Hymenobacteraceae bacterium]
YTDYTEKVNLVPGSIVSLQPTVSYKINDLPQPLPVSENFSSQPLSFSLPQNSNYKLEIENSPAFQFAGSEGAVGLVRTKQDTLFEVMLTSDFEGALPQSGNPVYLELDYLSTIQFEVGVVVNSKGQQFRNVDLNVRPNTSFNRLYVNLTEEVSIVNDPNATFKVFIRALPTGAPNGFIALDNIRLIHFKN